MNLDDIEIFGKAILRLNGLTKNSNIALRGILILKAQKL